jgi:hypothetical protein
MLAIWTTFQKQEKVCNGPERGKIFHTLTKESCSQTAVSDGSELWYTGGTGESEEPWMHVTLNYIQIHFERASTFQLRGVILTEFLL